MLPFPASLSGALHLFLYANCSTHLPLQEPRVISGCVSLFLLHVPPLLLDTVSHNIAQAILELTV